MGTKWLMGRFYDLANSGELVRQSLGLSRFLYMGYEGAVAVQEGKDVIKERKQELSGIKQ